jgi:GNAT superfamily N-acetyltransferase
MIRVAGENDLHELLCMSEEFWAAGGPIDGFDAEYTLKKLKQLIVSGMILVDRDLTGMIIIIYNEHLCVPKVNACELAWYVKPESRASGVGMELLKTAINISKNAGADTMTLAFMEKSMPNVIKSIYEKLGFQLSETSYIKRLK